MTFVFAKDLRENSEVVKLEAKSYKFTKYWAFYIFSYISVTSWNPWSRNGYFYANKEAANAWWSKK